MSDRLGLSSRRIFLMALTLTLSLSQFVITAGDRLWLAFIILGVGLAIVTQLAAIGTMHALLIDLCPGAAGRGSGLTMTGYYLGALAAPVSFGFIADRVGYSWAWAYCGVCAALSMVFFWSTKWVRRDAPATATA
jgi:MFS family permease